MGVTKRMYQDLPDCAECGEKIVFNPQPGYDQGGSKTDDLYHPDCAEKAEFRAEGLAENA